MRKHALSNNGDKMNPNSESGISFASLTACSNAAPVTIKLVLVSTPSL